jgi:hypothetical protein
MSSRCRSMAARSAPAATPISAIRSRWRASSPISLDDEDDRHRTAARHDRRHARDARADREAVRPQCRAAGRWRHQALQDRGADRERARRRKSAQVPARHVGRHPRAAGQARRPAAQHAHAHFIKNPDKRRRIARETMEIYAPLAERIGMYDFMREMQLLAFRELEPEAYATITAPCPADRGRRR